MPQTNTSLLQNKFKEPESTTLLAKVAVDLPLYNNNLSFFYYSIPDEIKEEVKTGVIVRIPFQKQELTGFVIGTSDINELKEKDFEIKPIYEVLHKEQIWDESFINFANWISKYYFANLGTVFASSVSSEFFDNSTNEVELVDALHATHPFTSEQKFIIDKLLKSKKQCLSYRFLMQKIKFSKQRFYQVINQLKHKGIIRNKTVTTKKSLRSKKSKPEINLTSKEIPINNLTLNNDQEHAYNTILKSINSKESKTFLLHGITGSGKTEVYLRIIQEVLKQNKTVIYLVPEIYLITQALERLKQRFDPEDIILWHSSLSKNERLNNFRKLSSAKIILGARSGILAPIKNIGLIVIDEAHESSYKQASPAPRYDTVKVAVKRGEIENCPVILGTATPNISDYYYCLEKNTILELPSRIENVPMPKVDLIDLKEESFNTSKNIISNILKHNINEALKKKEQIILLLNRRGYSSHIFCRACSYIQYCKNCSVPLVFHKNLELMVCHHCGSTKGFHNNTLCPECRSPHFKHFGLGTQQLEEEVKKIFPNAKILRVDSDQLKKKDEYIKLWHEFSNHNADILIGTQIVAKGLDLPNVTIVGVILADTMLNFPDYVSYERAFQLLTQVTGRTGRGEKIGKVFIQSYKPENPLFKIIQEHDYHSFYKAEIEKRKEFNYPPFTLLTRIIFQSLDETECLEYAKETLKSLSNIASQSSNSPIPPVASSPSRRFAVSPSPQLSFLGPAPCFFGKLHGKYRYHILCKIPDEKTKDFLFNNLFQMITKNAKVDLIIDVDSVNLL